MVITFLCVVTSPGSAENFAFPIFWRKLEGASNRDDPKRCHPDLESAIADIQLLGSPHQVALATQFAIEMARDRTSSLNDLLFDLRQSLRSELELERVSEKVIFLRFSD